MAEEGHFDKEARNTVNRLRNRGKYDYATIHSLVDSTAILHVSFNPVSPADDPFPVILPMLGATGSYGSPSSAPGSGPRSVYLHGHASSRFIQQPEQSGQPANGTPVCIAASQMQGLVLAYAPFHNSCNYRSAVVFGYAHRVTDEGERNYAMTLITDNMLPGRWDDSRNPPTKAELTSTGILRVEIVSASAKIREGSTSEDRKDLKDEELRQKVWTGVVPSYTQWGEPVPSEHNRVAQLSPYIKDWIAKENSKRKEEALTAIENGKK